MTTPRIARPVLLATLIAMTMALLMACPARLAAAPKPSLIRLPGTWQLDIEFHNDPMPIEVALPGETEPRTYWYLLYTVTNNTGQDIGFYPQFDLFTDTFQLVHAGVKVRQPVFQAIRDLYRTTLPLLEPESMVTGTLLQGEDNARTSAAIFHAFDPCATQVRVFVAGLTNETVKVDHPSRVDPDTKQPKEVLLRKTLMLQYQLSGDRYEPANRAMLYQRRKWIMR